MQCMFYTAEVAVKLKMKTKYLPQIFEIALFKKTFYFDATYLRPIRSLKDSFFSFQSLD